VSNAAVNSEEDPPNDNFAVAQSIPVHNGVGPSHPPSHEPSHAELEMWDNFIPTNSAFEIEKGPEEVEKEARAEFERKANQFGLWAGLETMPDEDMDHIENAWDEAKHDDILTEILKNLGQCRNYGFKL
jgi:hypothetical protein